MSYFIKRLVGFKQPISDQPDNICRLQTADWCLAKKIFIILVFLAVCVYGHLYCHKSMGTRWLVPFCAPWTAETHLTRFAGVVGTNIWSNIAVVPSNRGSRCLTHLCHRHCRKPVKLLVCSDMLSARMSNPILIRRAVDGDLVSVKPL